jgi:hypothetical protein
MMAASTNDPRAAWEATVATAVLGTSRAAGVPPLPSPLDELPAADQAPEAALVRSAAISAVYLRAGTPAAEVAEPQTIAAEETARMPSARAAAGLRELLDGASRAAPLLEEWCTLAAGGGYVAPPILLPELLRRAERDRGLRALLTRILGSRGRWLLEQNLEWQAIFVPPQSDAGSTWETGSLAQRLSLLVELRRQQPAAARALVEATWEQDAPDDRAKFLEALLSGLTLEDEPLLERALDDKRKSVRDAAIEALSRLPEAGFSRRMAARLEPLISYEPPARKLLCTKEAALNVTLPAELDAAARRDGLTARARGGLGAQAAVLADILAATPLSFWRRFGAAPMELLEAALATDYAQALIEGWQRAAMQQLEAGWAGALLRRIAANPGPMRKLGVEPHLRLASVLPAEEAEALAIEAMNRWPTEAVPSVLDQCGVGWSPALSRAVLGWLRASKLHSEYTLRHWLVQSAASRLDPSLADEAAEGWPQDWPPAAQQAVHEFAMTLRFREDFHKELAP